MDNFFKQKTRAAVLFLICLFALSFLNARPAWDYLHSHIAELPAKGFTRLWASGLESAVNDGVYQKRRLIDAYGYLQRLMFKREQSDFETVKDNAGSLHESGLANGTENTLALAESLRLFQSRAGDVPVLYVMPPDKYIRGFTSFPAGIPYGDANEAADSFLRMLSLYDIDAVDLRESFRAIGVPPEELFYKTDGRWTTQSGFLAFTELAKVLRERYGMGIDADNLFADSRNYNRLTYESAHLGELGERSGKYYAGADDFTLIYPKFDTDYTVRMGYGSLDEYAMSGRFEDALLSAEPFTRLDGAYSAPSDKYLAYSLVDRGVAHIRNNGVSDGPVTAFITDSMMAVTASLLSVACPDVYIINPVYFSGDIYEVLNGFQADIIIVSFSPRNLNQDYFSFMTLD